MANDFKSVFGEDVEFDALGRPLEKGFGNRSAQQKAEAEVKVKVSDPVSEPVVEPVETQVVEQNLVEDL